ncbi:carbamoyltransferase family protein [Hippea jasoniae]|uniref:carbamoyltransferase family protein n=1 Tax=Hippea jasoniae TaxID=944479 RepID=UPI000B1267AE|nr:carbamoyltransferase C-terminal domain-containing protein [Hippea jasoniae]
MITVGIHNTGYFSSCAVFKDDCLVFASAEERFSRIKYDNGFPFKAIEAGLETIDATFDDIDEIIIAWNPYLNATRFRAGFSKWVAHPMQRLYSNINAVLSKMSDTYIKPSEQIIRFSDKDVKVKFVNHHLSHIGMAYYSSDFKDSAILIADGYGENSSTILSFMKDGRLQIIKEHKFPHSLGMFYATMTEFLGFRPEKDEWKVMGASAFGDWRKYYKEIKRLISVKDGNIELDLSYFNFYNFDTRGYFSDKLMNLLGEPCNYLKDPQKVYDIAAATQKVFEESVIEILIWLHKQEPFIDNLCYGGGTAMNCLLNGKIDKLTPYSNIYVSFAPDDAGNAIGAVLYNKSLKLPNLSPYLGKQYDNKYIESILKQYKIRYRYLEDNKLYNAIADYLVDGKVIGWFQGKMEFGQRALGNRSILANPSIKDMKEKINSAVKFREKFRPFAPAIIDEFGDEYFEDYVYTPFMEKILKFKESAAEKVPAVVHNDKTGRVQSVTKNNNERFYNLIEHFYKKTGIPLLLNTSFNLAGEPIVQSPKDAIRTFFTSGLDVLVLGNHVVGKEYEKILF